MAPSTQPSTHPSADVTRRGVLVTSLSVGVATGTYAISFGALGVSAGFSVAQTCALSLLMFSGGSQFAYLGVISAGGTGAAAVGTATLLGSRNALYGLQVAPMLGAGGLRRVLAAHLTIDESTAVGTVQPRRELGRLGFWATGIAVFVLWNAFTLVGAVVGEAIGDPTTFGLDAAAGAAFLALLWPRLSTGDARAVAVLAALVAVVTTPLLPAGLPVLAAALVAAVVAVITGRRGAPAAERRHPATGGPR